MAETHVLQLGVGGSFAWWSHSSESYTKLTNPASVPGMASSIADYHTLLGVSSSGTYVAGPVGDSSIGIWKRSGDTLTKLTTNAPDVQTSGTLRSFVFSRDDTYLCVTSSSTVFVYKRIGDTFIKITTPLTGTLPTNLSPRISVFSHDNKYLICANGATNAPYVYRKNSGDQWDYIGNLGSATSDKKNAVFSSSGTYLAISGISDGTAGMCIYKRNYTDFCIDMYVRLGALPSASAPLIDQWIAASGSYTTGQWQVVVTSAGELQMTVATGASTSSTSGATTGAGLSTTAFKHVRVSRTDDKIEFRVGGTLLLSWTFSGTVGLSGSPVRLGYQSNNTGEYLNAYYDEVRILKGAGSWSADYTPPLTEFSDSDALMVLGMHMNDTGLTDVKGHAITLVGNAGRSTTAFLGGYSGYVDGSGDYISIAASSDFAFGSYTPFSTILSNLTTTGGVSFSPDETYLAVGGQTGSPICTLYKRSGDTFTAQASPWDTAPTNGTTSAAVMWSDDSLHLYISSNSSPYIQAYRKVGDTFVRLTNQPPTPVGAVNGVFTIQPPNAYNTFTPISGHVFDGSGNPIARTVRCYRRDTGSLVAETTSDAITGAYSLGAYFNKEHYVVALDPSLNAEVYDHVMPTA